MVGYILVRFEIALHVKFENVVCIKKALEINEKKTLRFSRRATWSYPATRYARAVRGAFAGDDA
jgi:hypothetical protein